MQSAIRGTIVIDWQVVTLIVDAVARESMLFAAVGFLIGGIDDLAIDIVFVVGWGEAKLRGATPQALLLADLHGDKALRKIAIFVPAWDEAHVIGTMLRAALARLDHPDYLIYVGAYPNDPETIAAVTAVARQDLRVRLVISALAGPTTKADCLNTLWCALNRDEAAAGEYASIVVIHDAEDVVHPAELRIFGALIGDYAAVQLPVLPLVDRGSRLIAGHYCDEFAESHAKQLIARGALGAALPLAGVGCTIQREMLQLVAQRRGGMPFDAMSLTEDYELGLMIASLGGRSILARVREDRRGPIIAVRAYFPATLQAAVRQKARWMIGIALAGWDRVGWGRPLQLGEHWMRMRDRRAPLAVLVLAAAYLALVAWGASQILGWLTDSAPPGLGDTGWLLALNGVLLAWRLAARALFTGLAYGPVEAALSLPRSVIANLVALLATRRAIVRYIAMLRGGAIIWDKTAHRFPDDLPLHSDR